MRGLSGVIMSNEAPETSKGGAEVAKIHKFVRVTTRSGVDEMPVSCVLEIA